MLKLAFLLTILVALLDFSLAAESKDNGRIRTFYSDSEPAYHAKVIQKDGACTILAMDWVTKYRGFHDNSPHSLVVQRKAAFQPVQEAHRPLKDNSKVVTIYGRREDIVRAHVNLLCKSIERVAPLDLATAGSRAEEPEVRKIVDSGIQANRIDVVFMGDGYTLEEKEEFFEDMARLTKDMFEGVTFRSYLPLFNIWAIFVESVESGIGYDGPKDTPFQLYRESGQLRGIFPGNPNYARTICTLTGAGGCDYPSIIANDDYYGGLGGEFVISTRSNRTGTTVLRHEMGHNFVNVGEEYDFGLLQGVNTASSVASLGWTHWLTGEQREERLIYRLSDYPWHDLSEGEHRFTFTSDGTYSRYYMLASVSAAGEEDCLEFELDGEIMPWVSRGSDDREFYGWHGNQGFTSGSHTLIVRSKTPSTEPNIPRMICSVDLHEYGSEDEFNISNDHISAYPTWDYTGRKNFRPTNEGCLMRNMTHNMLCNVCREGMWYEFFKTIRLIDNVTVGIAQPGEATPVTLNTLRVAHLREPGNEVVGEELKIRWFLDNVEQESLLDQTEILASNGRWRVEALFVTPEVRYDPDDLLADTASFTV